MQGMPQFLERDEVIRRLLIITEAVSKLPDNLLINFGVNINVLDKDVKETLESIERKTNSAYQAPFKLQVLDDTKGIADSLLKQLGFATDTKDPTIKKDDLNPPPPDDTFHFMSDDNPPDFTPPGFAPNA